MISLARTGAHKNQRLHVEHNDDDEGTGADYDHKIFPFPLVSLFKKATWRLNLCLYVCLCACLGHAQKITLTKVAPTDLFKDIPPSLITVSISSLK